MIDMNQKRFTFDDEETVSSFHKYNDEQGDYHVQYDYKNSIPEQETLSKETKAQDKKIRQKRPKTKIKKKTKTKIKKKRPQKIIKEKKRSWFSTLVLFLLSMLIIVGICIGGYIAYDYYTKQQAQIDQLQQQLQESQTQPTSPPVTTPPVDENHTQTDDNANQDETPQTPIDPNEETSEIQKRTQEEN